MPFVQKTLQFVIVGKEHSDIEKVRATSYAETFYNAHKANISPLLTINKRTLSLVEETEVVVRHKAYQGYRISYVLDADGISSQVADRILESAFPVARTVEDRKSPTQFVVVGVNAF